MSNVIAFRNPRQVTIFEDFIKPELKKGRWANTRPFGHSEEWLEAEAKVAKGERAVGRNFEPPRSDYDIHHRDFVAAVAEKAIRRIKKETGESLTKGEVKKELYDMMMIMRTPVGEPLATMHSGMMNRPGRPSNDDLKAIEQKLGRKSG